MNLRNILHGPISSIRQRTRSILELIQVWASALTGGIATVRVQGPARARGVASGVAETDRQLRAAVRRRHVGTAPEAPDETPEGGAQPGVHLPSPL